MRASVIVLAWNGIADLPDCLQAVTRQDLADYEVIVVDNGSTDGSAGLVAAQFPTVRLIRNDRNLGYSAGNNVGLRAATGELLVLLNQDTVVRADWLRALSDTFALVPSAGIVGSKTFYPDGRIQHAGGVVDAQGNGTHLGYGLRDSAEFNVRTDVDYVTGAALAISRHAFTAAGELDEHFDPAYFEDVDWCFRVRAKGFGVVYQPAAVLTHNESSRAAEITHAGIFRFQRNRLRFVLKHWPLTKLIGEFLPLERRWLAERGAHGERLVAAMHHAYLYQLLRVDDLIEWRIRLGSGASSAAGDLEMVLTTLRSSVPVLLPDFAFHPAEPASSAPASSPAPEPPHPGPLGLPSLPRAPQAPESAFSLANLPSASLVTNHSVQSTARIVGPVISAIARALDDLARKFGVIGPAARRESFDIGLLAALENMSLQLSALSAHSYERAEFMAQWTRAVELQLDSIGHDMAARHQAVQQLRSELCAMLETKRIDSASFVQAVQEYQRRHDEVLAEYLSENGRELAELAHEIRNLRARTDDGE